MALLVQSGSFSAALQMLSRLGRKMCGCIGGQGEVSGKDVEEKPQKAPPRLPPWTAQAVYGRRGTNGPSSGRKKRATQERALVK